MAFPRDRRYTPTHEWHRIDGDEVTIGISQFAVDELTDITYLEVTRTNGHVNAGDAIGEIESVKATSDLYTGVTGEVIAVNEKVIADPSIINQDPYDQGWILRIHINDPNQIESLLSAENYDASIG